MSGKLTWNNLEFNSYVIYVYVKNIKMEVSYRYFAEDIKYTEK
jgi:hypothetical protein